MRKTIVFTVLILCAAGQGMALAGNLEPPGPPAPTMKPLDQVEPRIPIRAGSLPLTITSPGSYYLVENVTTSGAGITIGANDVSIDLMGFALRGGTGSGIRTNGARKNLEIRNGTIAGWSASGIELTGESYAMVKGIRAEGNGSSGILIDYGSVSDSHAVGNGGVAGISLASGTVDGCFALSNAGAGIDVDDGTVSHSTSGSNTGHGIILIAGTVSDSEAVFNGGSGISVTSGATVRGCTATRNTSHGIEATGRGAVITESAATLNGGDGVRVGEAALVAKCTLHDNNGDGISVQNRAALIVGNHSYDNGITGSGAGIHGVLLATDLRIEDNHVVFNRGGGIRLEGTGSLVVKNSARLNAAVPGNYAIAAGNTVAPIVVSVAGAGPWDNFAP